jgi:hypothetical protein
MKPKMALDENSSPEKVEEFAELIGEAAADKTIAYLVENLGDRLALFGEIKAIETELYSSVSDAISGSLYRLFLKRKKN